MPGAYPALGAPLSLLAVLAMVGGYYLLATFVFPDDRDAWRDCDGYYLRTNRLIVGGILVINFSVVGWPPCSPAARAKSGRRSGAGRSPMRR
ncbi:MAG: hypothetical protein M3177_01140 [Pseudomonadota bacterium]|nr:hypothetical protein [Pseudomonadota bacterium]